jgi:hypothetical protein
VRILSIETGRNTVFKYLKMTSFSSPYGDVSRENVGFEGDFLDAVADLEGTAFEQGRQLGIEAALTGDIRMHGQQGGFNKAFPLAMELGFIEASEMYAATKLVASSKVIDEKDISSNLGSNLSLYSDTNDEKVTTSTPKEDPFDEDSAGGPSPAFLSKRSQKRRDIILAKIKAIPNKNCSTVDYESELQELRAMYRLGGSKAGRFLPETEGNSNSQSATTTTTIASAGGSMTW